MIEMSREEIDRFLREQTVGRLGYRLADATYIVPLIYAYNGDAIYVMTVEGQKTRAMRNDPAICFEVDEYDSATGNWRSVILHGRFEELGGAGQTGGPLYPQSTPRHPPPDHRPPRWTPS
jgi:nitroimidazol reductase NimA-like FMN-containing flavoprotein (pyridoxamine 5'-phosphate oxidase superfamily)